MNIQSDTLPTELPPGTAATDWSARHKTRSVKQQLKNM